MYSLSLQRNFILVSARAHRKAVFTFAIELHMDQCYTRRLLRGNKIKLTYFIPIQKMRSFLHSRRRDSLFMNELGGNNRGVSKSPGPCRLLARCFLLCADEMRALRYDNVYLYLQVYYSENVQEGQIRCRGRRDRVATTVAYNVICGFCVNLPV